jgi:hypothetical protein
MTTQTLSAVAINVLGNYNAAGRDLAQAYRSGAERLIGTIGTRYAEFVENRTSRLANEQLKSDLISAQQLLAGFVLKGMHAGTDRAVGAIDTLAVRAAEGINNIAKTAERVESALNINALQTVRTLNMPAADIALQVSEKVAQGAKAVQTRVLGEEEAAAPAPAKTARRTASRKR